MRNSRTYYLQWWYQTVLFDLYYLPYTFKHACWVYAIAWPIWISEIETERKKILPVISFMAAVVGVHVLIRRNNFLAVSFSSVLLITFAGAFYPIDSLPTWAATIAAYNPITYLVDIIRAALFGIEPLLAPPLEIGICIAFLVGLIIAAFCVAHCPFDTSNVQNVWY